jgi:hypothetical protein
MRNHRGPFADVEVRLVDAERQIAGVVRIVVTAEHRVALVAVLLARIDERVGMGDGSGRRVAA